MWNFSDITVTWNPPECEGTLQIVELVGDNGYVPPNQGTLVPIDATKWRYTTFDEPPAELCPERVVVSIAAMKGEQELTREQVVVRTVFKWLVSGHQHGPGAIMHTPTTGDYLDAVDFISWKYANVLATTGSTFAGVTIASTLTVSCGSVSSALACTNVGDGTVKFGISTFTGSENKAASIIGHELGHVAQGVCFFHCECSPYQWESDQSQQTGIWFCDTAYLQSVLQKLVEPDICP